MKKKILSLLLCIVMCLSLMPMSAFADGLPVLNANISTGGILSWDTLEGAASYYWNIGKGEKSCGGNAETTSIDLNSKCESYGFSAGDYDVTLYARNSSNTRISEEWKGTFHYNSTQETLDAPTSLRVEDSICKWNAVTNATSYIVAFQDADGRSYGSATVNDSQYAIDPYNISLVDGQDYKFMVKASAAGYVDSEYSESALFTYSKPSTTVTLQNVTISGGILSWDALEGAASYYWNIGKGEKSCGGNAETTSIDLNSKCESYDFAAGNYEVTLYARNSSNTQISEEWKGTFHYDPSVPITFKDLPETGVTNITVSEGDYDTKVAVKDAFILFWNENIKTDGEFVLVDCFDVDVNAYHMWIVSFENDVISAMEGGYSDLDTILYSINDPDTPYDWWVNGTFALDSCAVTFDPKGGSAIDNVTFTDATFGELPTPERDGYVFDGWYAQDYQEQDSVDYFYDAAIARAYILRLSNLPKAVGPTPGFKDGNVIDFDVVFTGTVPTNLDVNDYNISSNYYTIKNNEISGSIKFTNSMQDGGPQYGGNCLTFIDIETDYTDEKLDPSVSYAIKYFRVFPSSNQKVTAETAVPGEQNITLYAGWTKNVESAPTPITEVTVLNFESPIPGKTAGQLSNLQIPDGVHYKFDPDFPGNFSRWYDKKSEYGYLQNDVIFTVGKDYQEGAWLVADEGYYFADDCTFKAIGADNVEKELYEMSTFVDEYDITKANIWAVYEKAGTPITEVTVLNFESPISGKTTGELSNLQIPDGVHYKFDPNFIGDFSRWYDEESEYGYLMDDVTFVAGKDYQEGAWLAADEGYYFADDCTFKAIGADNTEKELDEMSTFVDEYDITKANIWAAYETAVAPIPVTYTIIVGANGEWTKGSAAGLAFTSDAPFAKFDSVQVDGSTIAATNYAAAEGSTKITLNPAYLETLSVGSHSIVVASTDGTASTNFTVKAAAQPPVPAKYTVSFNMNGHGTQIADQTVEDGSKAAKPADPKASGYTFGGWYADATFSTKFDFNTAITANTTVYAKWTKNPVTPPTPCEDHGHNVHHYDPDNAIVIGGKSGETAETNPETGAPVMNFGAIAVILGAAFLLSKKH